MGAAESYNTAHRDSPELKQIRSTELNPRTPSVTIDETDDDTTFTIGELSRKVLAAAYYRYEIMSEVRYVT